MIETNTIKTKKFFKHSLYISLIPIDRRDFLTSIAEKIVEQRHKLKKVRLNFICTHNSRRSQLAQVWAHYAIDNYKLRKIKSFSGGTETTAFHKNTVKTLQEVGFKFKLIEFSHTNPIYEITSKNMKKPIIGFSKIYNNESNKHPFIAITNCSSAEENCPFIPDAVHRFHLPYEDPKSSDDTTFTQKKYLETNQIIASEMNFLFQQVSDLL
ncbi:MAG: arsenate reductase [Urechidicola sp.]